MIIAISEKLNVNNFRSNVGEYDLENKALKLWYSMTHVTQDGDFVIPDFDMPKDVKTITLIDNDFGHDFPIPKKDFKKFYKDNKYTIPISKCLKKYTNVNIAESKIGETTINTKRV